MSNFDHLAKNLTSLTSFFTQKSIGPENLFRKYQNKPRIINQYSQVLKKLIHIYIQRFQFKAGFQPKEKLALPVKNTSLILPGQMGGLHSAPIPPPPSASNQSGFAGGMSQNQNQNIEKDYLFKFDQFYIEQIEMMMQLYVTGYNFIQNCFELNCVSLDKGNWQIIFTNVLNFFKLIFDSTQIDTSNTNTSGNNQTQNMNNQQGQMGQGNTPQGQSSNNAQGNNINKFIQRIERVFFSIQQQMINKIEDRPPLLNLLSSIVALSKYNGSQEYILNAIIDNFQNERLLEFQQEDKDTLLDTILNNYINLHSKLINKEIEYFFKVILNFYHYPTTHSLCKKLSDMIVKYYNSLKEIISKGDKKEISGFEQRKENEYIIECMRNLQKICQQLYLCCSNSGFSNIFLYDHVDNDLIKILHLTNQLEEQSRAKTNKDIQYSLYSLKNDCLKVFTVLMDHEIGCSSLNPKFNFSKEFSYLVEDIPQISHQQEFFELVGKQSVEIPQQLLDIVLKNAQQKGDDQMNEEQNEQPDFGQEEDEEENHIQKALINNDPNMQAGIIQYIQNIMDILQVSSKNLVGQMIILYKDYISYAYKSNPSLRLSNLTLQFLRNILPAKGFTLSNSILSLIKIFESYLFFISELTVHPLTQQFFYSEKRKNAIKTLIIDESILNEFNIDNDQSGQKQNENGRILDQIFGQLDYLLMGFMQELFEQSQLEHNQSDECMDLLNKLFQQCEKCKVILGYLKNYSCTIEEKAKSSHEKNPELPTEIRQPDECFSQINRQEFIKSNKSIEIMFQFLHTFTQRFIVDSNDIEREQNLTPWQQVRFSNLFRDFYGFQESRANHQLYNQQELNLDFSNFWDADSISKPNDNFNIQAVDLIKKENIILNQMDSFWQLYKRKQQLVEFITSHAVTFVNQFDINPINIYYSPYGKWETDITPLNEILHLQKKRQFTESKQRNPLTKHILETLKVVVKLKNPTQVLGTSLNQNSSNTLSGGPNTIAASFGIINSSTANPNTMAQNIHKISQNPISNQSNPNQQNIGNVNNISANANKKGINNSNQQPQQIGGPQQLPSQISQPVIPVQQALQQMQQPITAQPHQVQLNNNIPLSNQFPGQGIQPNGVIPPQIVPPPPPPNTANPPNSLPPTQMSINPLSGKLGQIPPPPPTAKPQNQFKHPFPNMQPPIKPNQQFNPQEYPQNPEKMQIEQKLGQNSIIPPGQVLQGHPPPPPHHPQVMGQMGGIMEGIPQVQQPPPPPHHPGMPRNNSGQKPPMIGMNYPPQQQSIGGGMGGPNQIMPRQFSGNMGNFPPPPPPQNNGLQGGQNRSFPPPQFQNQQPQQQGGNQGFIKNNMNIPPMNNQNQFGMNQQHGQHPNRSNSGGNYFQGQPIAPPQQGPSMPQQMPIIQHQGNPPPQQSYMQVTPPPPSQMMQQKNMGALPPQQNMRQGMQNMNQGQIHQQQPMMPNQQQQQQQQYQQQQLPPPPLQSMGSGNLGQSQQQQGANKINNELMSLTTEEKKIFNEKIEEIKQLSKNKNDPRSNKRIQSILNEHPKLAEILNKSKGTQSSS